MSIQTKNLWGASAQNGNGGYDQQRTDLFLVNILLPKGVSGSSNQTTIWDQNVQFALTKFPFPARKRATIATKYLNQTNFQLGSEEATEPITVTARYAFNQQTAATLEKWHWLTSHPSGGVGRTTKLKTSGTFTWLVPNLYADTTPDPVTTSDTVGVGGGLREGAVYILEGVLLTGLKSTDADMETAAGMVNLEFYLQIDRYYPQDPNNLYVAWSAN